MPRSRSCTISLVHRAVSSEDRSGLSDHRLPASCAIGRTLFHRHQEYLLLCRTAAQTAIFYRQGVRSPTDLASSCPGNNGNSVSETSSVCRRTIVTSRTRMPVEDGPAGPITSPAQRLSSTRHINSVLHGPTILESGHPMQVWRGTENLKAHDWRHKTNSVTIGPNRDVAR